ncbi:MmpS family transport accessory protein [Streptomyces sp. NBC_00057]|uniref:MmpS family transport accessory protein n=1 Tax=Streptomyces sp. NBC_00057 TaxID=2975634 RepID=UPI00324399FF
MSTDTLNTDTADATSGASPAEHRSEDPGTGRRTFIGAAITLLLAAGVVTYGFLATSDEPKPKPVPTASVTYEVRGSGTVQIDFIAHDKQTKSLTLSGSELPWRKNVEVGLGTEPTIRIVLDGKGGDAGCAVAVRGKHVQRSTAAGPYGRATCSAPLPAAQNASDSTSENSETQ